LLFLTLADHKSLERFERVPAPLSGLHITKSLNGIDETSLMPARTRLANWRVYLVVRQSAQQQKDRWDRIRKHFIQFQYMVNYLSSDSLRSLAFRDFKETAEQFDDREIGDCLAIRDRCRFADEPIGV